MIRTVIIEDELHSQELLQSILTNYCENIDVIGTAQSVEKAIELIKKVEPDLIFLDVEITGGTGFDILDVFENPDFKVIFVTGYEHYAIKAIKCAALDYILKPISIEEIRKALSRYDELSKESNTVSQNFLKHNVRKSDINQLLINQNNRSVVIDFDDIIYLSSDVGYVTFNLIENKKILTSKSMQYYSVVLPTSDFYRIHQSYIVALRKVIEYTPGRSGVVIVEGGEELPIAYRRKSSFVKKIKELNKN